MKELKKKKLMTYMEEKRILFQGLFFLIHTF